MCPIPAGWEEAYQDGQINECIPLFLETDSRHYADMDIGYCRDKIDHGCMWLWRRTNVDWSNVDVVRTNGITLAFHLWRPRYSNGDIIENRYSICLFLGNTLATPTAFLNDLRTAVIGFADDSEGRDRFYIVKTARYRYPARINAVFSAIAARLRSRNDAPAEHGWPERNVWLIADWS